MTTFYKQKLMTNVKSVDLLCHSRCWKTESGLATQNRDSQVNKLFKEVGMAVPKSMQTKVGMIEIGQVRRSSLI